MSIETPTGARRVPLLDRIVRKLVVANCWEFQGYRNSEGYGQIQRGARGQGAALVHRAMWELLVGEIPKGLDLDHLCRNRSCCNPDHLEPVTRQTNADRGSAAAGRPRHRTCLQGHEFTKENTIIWGANRKCRICDYARQRARRAARKAAA